MKLSLASLLLLALPLVALAEKDTGKSGKKAKPRNPAFAKVEDDSALPRVLLIGDSISIGYTVFTREKLAGIANVHRIPANAGHTGMGLEGLPKWLDEANGKWDVIHFNWGLWDLCYRNPDSKNQGRRDKVEGTLTHTPEQYAGNLEGIVQQLKKTGARLVFATTTPVPEGEAGRKLGDDLVYNRAALEVMERHGIAVNDLHAVMQGRMDEFGKAPGDVHFTDEGSAVLADAVAAAIRGQLASAAPESDASTTEIVILVGPEKHAPGTHEVAAGGRLMAHSLANAPNLDGVTARVLYAWPEDDSTLDSAATVVCIGDQFPGERIEDSDRVMAKLAEMTSRGAGLVCVHYATGLAADDVAEDGDHPLLHWTGGYFATRCRHHQSLARIFEATVRPALPDDHPIRRGWDTFEIRDEPYTRNWFGRDGLAENAIALATVRYPPESDNDEIVAWAIEREDGGRGAGITMPHFYRNWERHELRRFLFNTIAWTAGLEIPEGGVETAAPDLAAFDPVSIDPKPRKPKAAPKPKAPQP